MIHFENAAFADAAMVRSVGFIGFAPSTYAFWRFGFWSEGFHGVVFGRVEAVG